MKKTTTTDYLLIPYCAKLFFFVKIKRHCHLMNATRISGMCACISMRTNHTEVCLSENGFYHLLRYRLLSLPLLCSCIHRISMTESHTNFQCHHIETIILAVVPWFSLMLFVCSLFVNVAHAKIHSNIDEYSRTAYHYTRYVWEFVCRTAFNASMFAFGRNLETDTP